MRSGRVAACAVLLVCTAACDLLAGKKSAGTKVATTTKATATPQSRLCGSNATYAKLKESAFDEAKRIRERDTDALDKLADASVVRMENPLVESADNALGLTVCSGRMVLELPPGSAGAFDGKQRLAADVTYSAQKAADGSGTVYKIDGGEPIIYRLASFEARGTRTAAVQPDGFDPAPAAAQDRDVGDTKAEPMDETEPRAAPSPPRVPEPDIVDERELARDIAREQEREREATRLAEQRRLAREAQAEQTARAQRMRQADRRAEREARDARVAAARRDGRGEPDPDARPTRTARPSFNCRYARSRVEKTICGSDELASRDRGMANLYFRTVEGADPVVRRRLSASRLRFLSYRDRCGSEACIAAAYDDRVDEINDIARE